MKRIFASKIVGQGARNFHLHESSGKKPDLASLPEMKTHNSKGTVLFVSERGVQSLCTPASTTPEKNCNMSPNLAITI